MVRDTCHVTSRHFGVCTPRVHCMKKCPHGKSTHMEICVNISHGWVIETKKPVVSVSYRVSSGLLMLIINSFKSFSRLGTCLNSNTPLEKKLYFQHNLWRFLCRITHVSQRFFKIQNQNESIVASWRRNEPAWNRNPNMKSKIIRTAGKINRVTIYALIAGGIKEFCELNFLTIAFIVTIWMWR